MLNITLTTSGGSDTPQNSLVLTKDGRDIYRTSPYPDVYSAFHELCEEI